MTPEESLAYFSEWKTAYTLAFGGTDKAAALADLAAFCHERKTTAGDAVLEGRRQVILRIRNFLELSPDELVRLHTRPATGAISHARSDTDPDA